MKSLVNGRSLCRSVYYDVQKGRRVWEFFKKSHIFFRLGPHSAVEVQERGCVFTVKNYCKSGYDYLTRTWANAPPKRFILSLDKNASS